MPVGERAAALAGHRTWWRLGVATRDLQRQPLAKPVASPEPFIVGRAHGRLEIAPKVHRVLSAHVGIERLLVREDLDELKVVRGRRPAQHRERLDPGIAGAVTHEFVEHRASLVDERGDDIEVRDHEDLTSLGVATAGSHAPLEQIAVPFIERRL